MVPIAEIHEKVKIQRDVAEIPFGFGNSEVCGRHNIMISLPNGEVLANHRVYVKDITTIEEVSYLDNNPMRNYLTMQSVGEKAGFNMPRILSYSYTNPEQTEGKLLIEDARGIYGEGEFFDKFMAFKLANGKIPYGNCDRFLSLYHSEELQGLLDEHIKLATNNGIILPEDDPFNIFVSDDGDVTLILLDPPKLACEAHPVESELQAKILGYKTRFDGLVGIYGSVEKANIAMVDTYMKNFIQVIVESIENHEISIYQN